MSLFPATNFNLTAYPGEAARSVSTAGHGSPLFVIHKDVTKTLEEPNTINEIITGSEADAQYSVILNVPTWARGFIPYTIVNYTVALESNAIALANIQVVGASTNPLRYVFAGRIPNAPSEYSYNPVTAGMTSAVSPDTYGYWTALGALRLAAATGAGASNFIQFYSDNSAASPNRFAIATASANGLQRTSIASAMFGNSGAAPCFETLSGHTTFGGTLGTHPFAPLDSPYVALCGCDQLTCFAALGTAAPTVTASVTMATGAASNVTIGLGVRFVA